MSIVSDFGKKVSNKTKEISQKAKIMSETSSLNNVIKGEECRIDFQYKTIGKLYFEKFGENPEADFAEAIETIKASMEKIEETKKEIAKIKSRFNCPECGQAFKNDALFCSKCGAKLPEREEPAEKLPKNAQKCEKCGNVLPKDALFCNECGSSLAPQEAAASEENAVVPVNAEEFAPVENAENTAEAIVIAEKAETVEAEIVEDTKTEEAVQTIEEKIEVVETTAVVEEAKTEEAEQTNEKTCPNCSNKMDADDLFCNECGTKVE